MATDSSPVGASVSVIIPFYAGRDWLIEAVESVVSQTYPAKEIIVVNDGSSEDVEALVRAYGSNIVYIYKENGGPATARNLGIERASGDYIAFLDSDDLWLPRKLERQIAEMERTKCAWSHTGYETFTSDSMSAGNRTVVDIADAHGRIFPSMLMSNKIATSCVVFRGDVLRGSTKFRFNASMRYGQDQYLWLNVARAHDIVAINDVTAQVRIRGANAALRAAVQLQVRERMWQVIRREGFPVDDVPMLTKIGFRLSCVGHQTLVGARRATRSVRDLEFLARLFYIVPWLLFQCDYRRTVGRLR